MISTPTTTGADGPTIHVRDYEFLRAMDELAADSRRNEGEIVRYQAKRLCRALVYETPVYEGKKKKYRKGRARAGWFPAWRALGVRGRPPKVWQPALQLAEGDIVDRSHKYARPHIILVNYVAYIDQLEAAVGILARAFRGRTDDMLDAIEKRYRAMLRRKSGR